MTDIWLISDTHFGHKNILNFTRDDGSPLRPFRYLEEMKQILFDNWASVVKPGDKVYHLGDVAFSQMGKKDLADMAKLPGQKRLVLGNHDKYQSQDYLKVFHRLNGLHNLRNVWVSHAPIHPDSLNRKNMIGNAHGHLHYRKLADPRYFNCSVECIDYTPINLDEVIYKINKAKEAQEMGYGYEIF